MKTIILVISTLAMSSISFSQTAAEWMRQKKTQRKYLLQQIVAFQTYLGYLKKGYDIAHKGISTVRNIKSGEWNLHKDFFGSLSVVNPTIKRYAKVADIMHMQVAMVKLVKSLTNESKQTPLLSPEEIDHVSRVCDHLLSECLKNIDELTTITTSGQLEMKDDERINRIESIHTEMQDKCVFLRSFGKSVTLLSKQRLKENIEVPLSQQINGLNP